MNKIILFFSGYYDHKNENYNLNALLTPMNMKPGLCLSALCICLVFSCSTKKEITELPASELHPYGRYLLTSDNQIELISSAANVGFSFDGKECRIFTHINDENGHNYLQYELDDVYQKKIKISGYDKEPIVITAPHEGKHTVWLYKATEAHTGPIFIEKISGPGLEPLERKKAPLIEFVGNSITCGALADPSEVPCGQGVYHDQHNAYYAYGPRVARTLKANFIVSSVSGTGIYRFWNADGPAMPNVYEKTDFQEGSDRMWDFTKYSPDVVSIALGTNDYSDGDGQHERAPFDSATFVAGYIKFVELIKSKYRETQIALLSSPMVQGERNMHLQNCLTAVKNNIDTAHPSDKPVALFFFEPMQPHGCSYHPSVEDHAVMAEELVPFFKRLL